MAEIVPGNALEGEPDEEEVVVKHPEQDDDGPLIRNRGRRRRRRLCPRPRGVQRRSRGYAERIWVKAAARLAAARWSRSRRQLRMVEEAAAAAASPRSTGIVGGGRLVGDGACVSGLVRQELLSFS